MVDYDVSGPRATVTLNDPERRNPLSNAVMAELASAVRVACSDRGVRAIVLTGAGDRAFSAGGDLASGFVDSPLDGHAARGALVDLVRTMRRCPKPIIARVNGHALGGGFGLVAASDLAIAAEHAMFGTPEIDVGLWPMMITAVLRPLVPRRALLEMMLVGRRFDAAEAVRLGIVNRTVAAGALDAAVDEVVDVLVTKSAATIALGKAAFYAVADLDEDTALDHLHAGLTAVAMTEDAGEGVSAFVEKRPAEWTGR